MKTLIESRKIDTINFMDYSLPQPVINTLKALTEAGFEAHIVGGCVRDLLLHREPKDWDITTNAKPEEVQKLFPDSFYENDFGTVGVKVPRFLTTTTDDREHPACNASRSDAGRDIIEVTTYRIESTYSDRRRPDAVHFAETLEEDLSRRDFTINSIAAAIVTSNQKSVAERENPNYQLPITNYTAQQETTDLIISDPFNGRDDIKNKIIRAVGTAEERFNEDALRMMRAIRLFSELSSKKNSELRMTDTEDWKIEDATLAAIKKSSALITHVSMERIRDEFSRIILSPHPKGGIELLEETGLLHHIVPELEEGIGCGQNLHHIYTVWEHNLRALETCPSKKLHVRLAALLHDVGKPKTKRGDGLHSTFYNHDHVGARMTRDILTRLRYPKEIVEKATLLVDYHLFYYNVGEVSEASVRRLVRKVGLENMPDLMDVRIGDRLGSGTPKAKPYKLRHLEYMIDKVSKDPISVKMLAIKGTDLMQELDMSPGPKIGALLDVLLAEVIEDPKLNIRESLLTRSKVLMGNDLDKLRKLAKEKIKDEHEAEEKKIKKTHWVE
jgi:poly(A) polymerase/tRNA nucleotidyltransferase (CCA-adding enzyme)